MLFELTLIANFILIHLTISTMLYVLLATLIRFLAISAEMRSWLWVCVFVLCTLTPFAAFTPHEQSAVTTESTSVLAEVGQTSVSVDRNEVAKSNAIPELTIKSDWLYNSLAIIYGAIFIGLLGSLWRIVGVAQTIMATVRLKNTAIPATSVRQTDAPRQMTFYTSTLASTPMAIGLFNSIIVVPKIMEQQLSSKQLSPILLHELAHIQRRDLWVSLFQEVIAIIFWWSPATRLINRQIHLSRELACDYRAAQQLSNNQQYAQSLLDCAKIMVIEKRNVMAMGLFSKKKELTLRINEMLKPRYSEKPKAATILLACLALSATSALFAQTVIPKVAVKDVRQSANHYSTLSEAKTNLLIAAIQASETDVIELMMEQGLDINTPLMSDGTALIIAVKNNDQTLVSTLIDLGADVNQSALGDGNPLISAAMSNHLDMAKYLLDNGADIDAVVKGDETALINASHSGYYDMVQLLLESGADANLGVNAQTIRGIEFRSPLNRAKTRRISRLLTRYGAKI